MFWRKDHKTIILSIELPDRVWDVRFTEVTKSSANMSWRFINRDGEAFHYTIDCNGCSKSYIFPVNTNHTSVILRGLDASTQYNISVIVNNSITRLTGQSLYKFSMLHTRAGGMKYHFVKLLKLSPDLILLDPPLWSKSLKA